MYIRVAAVAAGVALMVASLLLALGYFYMVPRAIDEHIHHGSTAYACYLNGDCDLSHMTDDANGNKDSRVCITDHTENSHRAVVEWLNTRGDGSSDNGIIRSDGANSGTRCVDIPGNGEFHRTCFWKDELAGGGYQLHGCGNYGDHS